MPITSHDPDPRSGSKRGGKVGGSEGRDGRNERDEMMDKGRKERKKMVGKDEREDKIGRERAERGRERKTGRGRGHKEYG